MEEQRNGANGAEITQSNQSLVKKPSAVKTYFKALPKRYFITAFSGMAQGLFVTLIAGTILAMFAGWLPKESYMAKTLTAISNVAKTLMGAGIGVGIAHALGKNKLLIFSAAAAGMIGAFAENLLPGSSASFSAITLGKPGNPIGAYVATMLVVEVVSLYAGKTKLDIILVPLGALILSFAGVFAAYPFIKLIGWLSDFIAFATDATPFVMGIVIAVVMGVLLTMPTSSAAIWVAVASPVLNAAGAAGTAEYNAMLLAGGAATVGCACHMVGFAVASFRENKWSGLIAQGLGTSMLQIPNIMKKPVIMLPMIISSAILGPLSTCVFKVKCGASGGGMGTSGLVGVFNAFEFTSGALGVTGIILLMIVLPAALNLLLSELFRKKGWIKPGDMKLPD